MSDNPEDYKEYIMKKYNLSEEKWQQVLYLYKFLSKFDDISIVPPIDF